MGNYSPEDGAFGEVYGPKTRVDTLRDDMTAHAIRYHNLYERPKTDEISLLFDSLDPYGFKFDDLTSAEYEELDQHEESLFQEYLMEDEPDDEEYEDD